MATEPILIARIASLAFDRLEAAAGAEAASALAALADCTERIDEAAPALERALFAAAGPAETASGATAAEESSLERGAATALTTASRPRVALLRARRAVHQRRAAAVRGALPAIASFEPELDLRLRAFAALLQEADDVAERHARAHASAVARGAARLLALAREPRMQEGLRLASRSLLEKVLRLERIPLEQWKHSERHTALKLAGYLARAATKTSPQGVFCATSV